MYCNLYSCENCILGDIHPEAITVLATSARHIFTACGSTIRCFEKQGKVSMRGAVSGYYSILVNTPYFEVNVCTSSFLRCRLYREGKKQFCQESDCALVKRLCLPHDSNCVHVLATVQIVYT